MKSHVHAFTCDSCGGTLTNHVNEPAVRCPWCDTDNLLTGDDLPRTYWLEPLVQEKSAVRAVREATSLPDVEGGFSGALRIERRDLVFLPFNALRAIRTGRMLLVEQKPDRVAAVQRQSFDSVLSTSLGSPVSPFFDQVHGSQPASRTTTDTKILFAQIVLSEPACDASDLGDAGVSFERNVFGSSGPPLKPYSREEIAQVGSVLEPERHPRELVRRLDEAGVAQVGDQTTRRIESVGIELYQIFYPVWVIRGTYAGRSHRFVVDALDGSLLTGRVPASRTRRAAVGTAGVFLAAAPVALALRAGAWYVSSFAEGVSGDLLMMGLLASVLLLALGWGLTVMGWLLGTFRRSKELVFRAGALNEDTVDLPGRGALERMGLRMLEWSDRVLSTTGKAQRYG